MKPWHVCGVYYHITSEECDVSSTFIQIIHSSTRDSSPPAAHPQLRLEASQFTSAASSESIDPQITSTCLWSWYWGSVETLPPPPQPQRAVGRVFLAPSQFTAQCLSSTSAPSTHTHTCRIHCSCDLMRFEFYVETSAGMEEISEEVMERIRRGEIKREESRGRWILDGLLTPALCVCVCAFVPQERHVSLIRFSRPDILHCLEEWNESDSSNSKRYRKQTAGRSIWFSQTLRQNPFTCLVVEWIWKLRHLLANLNKI